MAHQLLAWVAWDVLSAVLVLALLLAPVALVGGAVYVVVRWRRGGEQEAPAEPSMSDDAEPERARRSNI